MLVLGITGLWLVSADVTGERDESRIGLGPTCVVDPARPGGRPGAHRDDRPGHRRGR
jgi:hypothetical protein